jgi:hypothetical protein
LNLKLNLPNNYNLARLYCYQWRLAFSALLELRDLL